MSLKVESPAAVVTQSKRSTNAEQDPRRLGSMQFGVFATLFAVPTNRPYFGLV